MKNAILISSFLVYFTKLCFSQSFRYHEYDQTASDYKIIKWNIPKDSLPNYKNNPEELDVKSCLFKNIKQNAIDEDTSLHKKVFIENVSPFQSFVNKFDYRELPYNINVASKDWINFNTAATTEINRADVVKFLCNKNDNCVKQPTGGFYQYYFGYRIKLKEKVGLIYYRISSDYTGYILSIFDTVGVLQSTLFLSGVKGEYDPEAQKEAVIGSDCIIEIGEIIFKSGIDYSGTTFKANYSLKKYQVSLQGKIVELSTVNRMEIDVKCDKTQKDRIIIVTAQDSSIYLQK